MPEPTGLDCELKHLESVDEAGEFLRWLGERRPVLGFDTETGGLRWWDEALRLVQFGDALTGWVISYRDWRGVIVDALKRYDRPLTAHNLAFDAKFCIREGLPIKRHLWHDTLPMSHLLDPPGAHGLKPLSEKLIDPWAHAGAIALEEGKKSQGWTWATVPETFAPYIWYSALDGVLAARMHEILKPLVIAQGTWDLYELEVEDIWASVDMEMRGPRIDVPYVKAEQLRLRARADELRVSVRDEYELAIGSNDAVTQRLVADGIALEDRTPSGRYKLDKEVLESLRGRHPLGDAVIEYKQSLKFATTYYGGMLQRIDADGILHPEINTLGARTSRQSVSKPAAQQFPSHDPRPRRSVIPRTGNVLLSGDLSNIEPRIMAHLSEDPTMVQAFLRGEDVHTSMARHMYADLAQYPPAPSGLADDEHTLVQKARKKSKSGSLGKMYGIGPAKFASQQGVTLAEAEAFIAYYDETFPGIAQFILDVQEVGAERYHNEGLAYVRDPAGRVHTLRSDEARAGRYYALVNFIIQGYAATLLKRATVRFARTEFGYSMILPVHDELILDVPEDDAKEAGDALHECLVSCDDGRMSVPLAADIEIYRESWAESVKGFKPEHIPRTFQ